MEFKDTKALYIIRDNFLKMVDIEGFSNMDVKMKLFLYFMEVANEISFDVESETDFNVKFDQILDQKYKSNETLKSYYFLLKVLNIMVGLDKSHGEVSFLMENQTITESLLIIEESKNMRASAHNIYLHVNDRISKESSMFLKIQQLKGQTLESFDIIGATRNMITVSKNFVNKWNKDFSGAKGVDLKFNDLETPMDLIKEETIDKPKSIKQSSIKSSDKGTFNIQPDESEKSIKKSVIASSLRSNNDFEEVPVKK